MVDITLLIFFLRFVSGEKEVVKERKREREMGKEKEREKVERDICIDAEIHYDPFLSPETSNVRLRLIL